MSENDFTLYINGQPIQVSEEVYQEFMRAEEKERYFMRRLKKGRFLVDSEQNTVIYIPSRETSYEQLLEEDWDFPSPSETVDDTAVKAYLLEKLQESLHSLSDEEMALIQELFYLEWRFVEPQAAWIGVSSRAILSPKNTAQLLDFRFSQEAAPDRWRLSIVPQNNPARYSLSLAGCKTCRHKPFPVCGVMCFI